MQQNVFSFGHQITLNIKNKCITEYRGAMERAVQIEQNAESLNSYKRVRVLNQWDYSKVCRQFLYNPETGKLAELGRFL